MARDRDIAVEDGDHVVADEHLDGAPNEPVRDAVADGVDVDKAVGGYAPRNASLPNRERIRRQWTHCRPLLTLEAIERPLTRRAVDATIGVDHPAAQMCLEICKGGERESSQCVALDVPDARLGLALRTSAIRLANPSLDAPVAAETVERRMQARHVGRVIAASRPALALSASVKATRAATTAGKWREGAGQTSRQSSWRWLSDARVNNRREFSTAMNSGYRDHRVAHRHMLLAEVDLHLMARRSLEANSRHLGGAPSLTVRHQNSLQCPHRHRDASLREQPPYDDRVSLSWPVEKLDGQRAC